MPAPRNISLEEIKSVTNNFSDSNFIGEGFLGRIYKGQLSRSEEFIDVSVRRLDHSFWLQEIAFDKEISILSRLEHKNMVSFVGFCYENNEMLIINKRVARGSLRRKLSDPRLTWKIRLQISIGVVSALNYLHDDVGKNFSIIHHNINSNTILLDENWEAKISGFEYSMSIPSGDLDLAYEKLGIATYKSDVFSVGIVLFELLCGREAFLSEDKKSFQPSLAIFHYVNGTLHKLVQPDLFSQMDLQSFNIFSETAYYCLVDYREPRVDYREPRVDYREPPTVNQILKRLEKALAVQQMPKTKELSTVADERILPDHLQLKLKSLEHMRIRLADIQLATDGFSNRCIVSIGGYGSVHKAELEHVDKEYCCAMKGESEREMLKKRSIVAIKRIINIKDEMAEQGFYAEIEMLTSRKHSNIIPLLGFCNEGGEMILIYEYASNGSLNEYIRKKSEIRNDSWSQRVKICLDVAKGLSCLHAAEGDQPQIVHRDIKSANILLGENFEAKIGDFGLSVFLSVNEDRSTLYSRKTAGTQVYKDPQYSKDAKLRKELDIYSFGVVMFEILCGTLAYYPEYTKKNKGLALIARQHFDKGTINEIVDSKIKEEITETLFTSVKGPNQESIEMFSSIANKCLAKAQGGRPTMEAVVKDLQKALFLQENRKDIFQISLKDLQLATNNFNNENFIDEDGSWIAYRGEVPRANGYTTRINVKRLRWSVEGFEFSMELKVLMEYKHKNVIGLIGYCLEGDERIIVSEYAVNGSLEKYVDNVNLTWGKRLKICIDVANGLDFLHGGSVTGEVVIHRNIKSCNILLDDGMNAKISDFVLAVMHPVDQADVSLDIIAGTTAYLDPAYENTGLLSTKSDIYSFGIVLFEILLQRFAYSFDEEKQTTHLGLLIKDLYKQGKLDELMFEGKNEQIVPQSLAIFRRLAIQCLQENREERPSARDLIIQLTEALEIQEKGMDIVRISFEEIKDATDNFGDDNKIGCGESGTVFKGQLPHVNGPKIIAAKRMEKSHHQRDPEFYQELEILLKFKHKNIIGLEGYCDEKVEKIIVYEYASNGSLDKWLNKIDLTWRERIRICIDVARGLEFLHGGVLRQQAVIHRDIKSSNILLSCDWEGKITDFGLSLISPNNQEIDYVIVENPVGTLGYIDPAYMKTCTISKAADIYSFGVVLFEILCGRPATNIYDGLYLGQLAKNYYEQNKLDEVVFDGIKEQIAPPSLSTYAKIAYQCLHDDRLERPTASEVLVQLEEAWEFQVGHKKWGPNNYKEIIKQSQNHKILETKTKKDIYDILCEGLLIQKDKVWFRLDSNNNTNLLISATLFTYEDQSSQKWRRIRKSRFRSVSLMTNISNLMIQAQIKAQFLTPNVLYGVYLIFKFGEPNKPSSKPKYVNLKYKRKNETLHAYFATRRDNDWMMIELYRFLNQKDDCDFEVLLESFSRYYCRSGAIYVEGIEFRAIDYVTHEENDKIKDVQQTMSSNSNMGQMQQISDNEIFGSYDEGAKLSEMNRKKNHMLSAKEVLDAYPNAKPFKLKPSEHSRLPEVVEVQSQQVIRIKCKIESQILSSDTDYNCYMIFKLSEKCRGLHCPVKVREVFLRSNKEIKALYFRPPNASNIHDINQLPKQREDGWMEVNVWKFNSKNELIDDHIHVNLKLISYEGTMSGLIVCGVEFRPL